MKGYNRCRLLAVLVLALALTGGCSSSGRAFPDMDQQLSVQIWPNDSKEFVYRLSSDYAPRIDLSRSGRQRPPSELPADRAYRHLQRNVDLALAHTGFCREGYLELDRRLNRALMWIRGECREGATQEDRTRFGERAELPLPDDFRRP
ncbi:hypothetical protein [Marinimicrobium alkaliphilum]|uniref:hypothetical protein n=1 Tax=Marinimicrobium alkaliphilum TaxID=2202654 RepID=UPI0013009840|nr:hypothetical protein [Marinimicrobium alkaliphilum]